MLLLVLIDFLAHCRLNLHQLLPFPDMMISLAAIPKIPPGLQCEPCIVERRLGRLELLGETSQRSEMLVVNGEQPRKAVDYMRGICVSPADPAYSTAWIAMEMSLLKYCNVHVSHSGSSATNSHPSLVNASKYIFSAWSINILSLSRSLS